MRTFSLLVCFLTSLTVAAQGQPFWCWDADEVTAEVEGSTVYLQHLAALLNCCPEPITYEIDVGDATIMVVERSESPCDCECCFNLGVTLEGVPAGAWNILYRWFDWEIFDWAERVLQIEVPDLGQGYVPVLADQQSFGCLETASAPVEPPTESATWGNVKARYR